MKKIINILIILLLFQAMASAQCGINCKEILQKYCKGEYLKHQELNNRSGAKVSMILEKDSRYAIYLLNPDISLPELKMESDTAGLFKDFETILNQGENQAVYIFTATETGEYYFSLDFGTDEKACILMAIYLQNDTWLKAGIYRNFEEFRYNNPSVEFNYQVSKKMRKYGDLRSSGRIPYYRLNIARETGKSIGKVFGFCDGTNVFINENNPDLGPKTEFVQIENLGRFCYFEDRKSTTIFIGTVPSTLYYIDRKIIDANTGEIVGLNKKTLQEIIADDDDLLEEFKNDPNKGKKLKEYLIKYLEK
jgi:hypothetical protein